MFRSFHALLLGAIIAAVASGLGGAATAQTIYEFAPTDITIGVTDGGYLASVTVASPVTITAIAQQTTVGTSATVKFFIRDRTNGITLHTSTKTFGADVGGAFTFKQSDAFAPITLVPGNTYDIGLVANAMQLSRYSNSAPAVQSGVSMTGSAIYGPYSAPTFLVNGPESFSLRLVSAPPTSIPTLSEWAMILFGLTLAGGAALYIQRRRLAA